MTEKELHQLFQIPDDASDPIESTLSTAVHTQHLSGVASCKYEPPAAITLLLSDFASAEQFAPADEIEFHITCDGLETKKTSDCRR